MLIEIKYHKNHLHEHSRRRHAYGIKPHNILPYLILNTPLWISLWCPWIFGKSLSTKPTNHHTYTSSMYFIVSPDKILETLKISCFILQKILMRYEKRMEVLRTQCMKELLWQTEEQNTCLTDPIWLLYTPISVIIVDWFQNCTSQLQVNGT